MAVKRLDYAKRMERNLAKGKSVEESHKAATETQKEKKKLNWAQKLKVKVGITLKKEKRRRARLKARFPKAKKSTTRTKSVKSGLKKAGLTKKEMDRFK